MRMWMLALVPVLVAAPASGQAERQAPQQARAAAREMRAPVLGQVEHALRLRETLNLAESQVERLDALRREILNRQTDQAEEGRELMSRMRAGLVEREEAERLRTAARETWRAEANSVREQFDAILSDEQREQLREERVAAVRGRRMAQPARAPRLRAMPVPPRARVMPPRARMAPMPPSGSMRRRGDAWGWQGYRFEAPRLRRFYEYGPGRRDIPPVWRQRD